MPFLAPIVGAITGAISAIGATAIGSFALKLAGSLLLSAASSALMGGAKTDETMQGRTVSVREPVAARRIIYGRARVGGTIVFMTTRTGAGSDRPNNELHMVIVLAGHRVRSIGAVYLNGELAINAAGAAQARFAGNIGLEKHLGVGTDAPFSYLRSISAGEWTTAHRLVGCAAIAISFNYDPEIYPSGIPNVAVDVEGCDEIYDPRSLTTGYSENPALCLAHYMAHPRYGLNAAIGAADGLASAELIAAANVCDETVLKVGGGTEPRYNCNGLVDLSNDPQTIIEDLLTAMAGDVVYQAGQWRIYAGAWRTPVTTLTADDITDGGLRLDTRISRASNFNGVRGTFISPENDWAADDFPAYASSVYLAEDKGERIWTDIKLPYTISSSMAQRLAKIHLERQRRQMQVTAAGKLAAWRVATMDNVYLNYARWGFSGKAFEVRGMSLSIGDTISPTLTLRETSSAIWDWSTSEAQIYAAAPRTNLPSAFSIPAPGSPEVEEELYATRAGDGVKAKAIISWPKSDSPYVVEYEVRVSLAGGAWKPVGKTADLSIDQEDVAPGVYTWQVSGLNRLGVRSPWVSVTKEIFGLGAAPSALQNVTLQSAGGLAALQWDLSSDLDVRIGGQIVIRHSAAAVPTWANSVSMLSVAGGMAIALCPLKPGTYLIRPVDSSGVMGPVTPLTTNGVQVIPFLAATTLQEDTAFSGTKTGTIVDTGTLRLNTTGNVDAEANFDAIANLDALGGALSTGTYDFVSGMNFGSVKKVRLRSVIDLTVVGLLDNVDTRPGTVDDWISFDGIAGGEVDVRVEYRTTQTSPTGSPVWSTWARVENTEIQAWGVQGRAILTSKDAGYTPAISQLRLTAEEAA